MVLIEGTFVLAAVLVAGALVGYLYHEHLARQRSEIFVDRATVAGFLARKHGITLVQEDWDSMTQPPPPDGAGRVTMLNQ